MENKGQEDTPDTILGKRRLKQNNNNTVNDS